VSFELSSGRSKRVVTSHESTEAPLSLEEVVRAHVRRVLARARTLKDAAEQLGIHPVTLWRLRQRWHLD
jgi:hypothetical protein